MVFIPRPISLVTQVADSVRRAIEAQEWVNQAPSEKFLARQLQVSRMTAARALKILAREGLLKISKGRRAQIVVPKKVIRHGKKNQVVGVITPSAFSNPLIDTVRWPSVYYESYRSHMQNVGLQTRFYSDTRFYSRHPSKVLDALIPDQRVDLWVLTMSTLEMQQWFSRHKLPTIIDGSCQPGVQLPALDVDYRGVCRHAVGKFIRFGHTRIALLSISSPAGGDLASIRGFNEGISQSPSVQKQSSIVYCEDSVESCSCALDRLLRGDHPPTAILTLQRWLAFTTLSFLSTNGFRVPDDVSLISRDDPPNLSYLLPSVACYRSKQDIYAHRLVRMIQRFFDGTIPLEQQFFIPTFQNGKSLGPCKQP